MLCPQCQCDIHPHYTECPECGYHLGFPNVRQAHEAAEVAALRQRYLDAMKDLDTRGAAAVSQHFEQLVANDSRPVICRRWGMLIAILDQKDELFQTFYGV